MKRTASSSSKSVSSATKSKQPEQTSVSTIPVSKELPQKQVDATTTPVKKQRKEKAPPKEEAFDKTTVKEVHTPVEATPQSVGGVELDVELANVPADDLEVRCVEYFNALKDLVNKISDLKNEYKTIERAWAKKFKSVSKAGGKKKKKVGTRAPSGFVKPTLISDELASFLGKDTGTEMARTEVTREINVYIRTNKLQDAQNGRRINADTALSALLKLSPGDELTYFNLQKYMSCHFPKTPVV
jgi:chromatin remodeling complex protein RSC6